MACQKRLKPGYHLARIPKGELGELSKLREELLELEDAIKQNSKIMALIELADLLGAIEWYLEKHHPGVALKDLQCFSLITRRAFENDHRAIKRR